MIMQLRYRSIQLDPCFKIKSDIYSYYFYAYALPRGFNKYKKFGIDFTWWSYPINSISNFSYGIKIKKP